MCMFVKFRKIIETNLLYDKNNHIFHFTLTAQTLLRSLLYVYSFRYAIQVLTIFVIYTLKID